MNPVIAPIEICSTRPRVRCLRSGDLRALLEQEPFFPIRAHLPKSASRFFSSGVVGCVAESAGAIIGVAICRVRFAPRTDIAERSGGFAALWQALVRPKPRLLLLQQLEVIVRSDCSHEETELLLIGSLCAELWRAGAREGLIVPESLLSAQLRLREGGCRAQRVLRNFFGNEDGYLMQLGELPRRAGWAPLALARLGMALGLAQ